MMRIHWVPILVQCWPIVIHPNYNLPTSNNWRIVSHSHSILLSFFCFEINEAITSMSSMILLARIFTWKIPLVNLATMSEFIYNLISSHLVIDIMNPDFICLILRLVSVKPLIRVIFWHLSLLHLIVSSLWRIVILTHIVIISVVVSSIWIMLIHLISVVISLSIKISTIMLSSMRNFFSVHFIEGWVSVWLFFILIWLTSHILRAHIVVVVLLSRSHIMMHLILSIRRRISSPSWFSPIELLFLVIIVVITHIDLWYRWLLVLF